MLVVVSLQLVSWHL